ncbi:hypothetical protein HYQ45_000311 [Verticillium longisporum]|uniref:Uncharacterized protein n=1 Tax=Verticillium longisporum TaxID=100787 RepID=A0A8I3A3N6_VERLO|nr:hypothetical protein HYQ45_000311 [Verticillium longisporum]
MLLQANLLSTATAKRRLLQFHLGLSLWLFANLTTATNRLVVHPELYVQAQRQTLQPGNRLRLLRLLQTPSFPSPTWRRLSTKVNAHLP